MKLLIASLFGLLGLTVAATAQETTYSADSLMAAFDKASPKTSLKGTDIVLRDVVVDSRDSKITFRSSQSNRVICELNPAAMTRNKQPAVGTRLTVTGTVRGRGLLGNVTLDNCGFAPASQETAVAAEVIPQPEAQVAIAPGDVLLEPGTADAIGEPAGEPAKSAAAPRTAKSVRSATGTLQKDAVPAPRAEQPGSIPKNPGDSHRRVYLFYALLVLSGAIGSSILSRLMGSVRSVEFSRPSLPENRQQIRQAALQALLEKASKAK